MIKSMNAAWWVKRWSDLHPEKPAIIFGDRIITYSMLHRRLDASAAWLQSLGIEKGDRVAVMMHNCPQFMELCLACSRLGAVFVPVNFRLAPREVEYTLQNCRPRVFVFGAEFSEKLEGLNFGHYLPPMLVAVAGGVSSREGSLPYGESVSGFEGKEPFLTASTGPNDPEEAQVIMYTSGTTGEPKGAVLSHRKTFFNCLNADIFFKLSFDDVMLVILPLFHSGGLFIQAAPCLYKGATMVIHRRFSPQLTYADIQRYRVTKFLGVPTIYRALLSLPDEQRTDISSLKVCAIGGEKTTPELITRCNAAGFPLRQIMGQTETSILLWASEEDLLARPGTVGRPVFHAEVDLVDKEDRTVGPGEVGEIVVRGSIMMTEYWQDPRRTRETIRDGWLHTGDLAFMDEQGDFYLVDRVKDMYISGGENVYPAEVEKVLEEHPGVEEAAVVGIPDQTWGEVGHAFVIKKEGYNLSAGELIEFCRGRLANYKLPKRVSFVKDFPRTTLGKVRKHLLAERSAPQGLLINLSKETSGSGRRGVKGEQLECRGIMGQSIE